MSESESVAETNLGLEDALEENERDLERDLESDRLKKDYFLSLLSFMNRIKLIQGNASFNFYSILLVIFCAFFEKEVEENSITTTILRIY